MTTGLTILGLGLGGDGGVNGRGGSSTPFALGVGGLLGVSLGGRSGFAGVGLGGNPGFLACGLRNPSNAAIALTLEPSGSPCL